MSGNYDSLKENWDLLCSQVADMCSYAGAPEGAAPDSWTLRDALVRLRTERDEARAEVLRLVGGGVATQMPCPACPCTWGEMGEIASVSPRCATHNPDRLKHPDNKITNDEDGRGVSEREALSAKAWGISDPSDVVEPSADSSNKERKPDHVPCTPSWCGCSGDVCQELPPPHGVAKEGLSSCEEPHDWEPGADFCRRCRGLRWRVSGARCPGAASWSDAVAPIVERLEHARSIQQSLMPDGEDMWKHGNANAISEMRSAIVYAISCLRSSPFTRVERRCEAPVRCGSCATCRRLEGR